jgi:SAM-dependent methyltransferase
VSFTTGTDAYARHVGRYGTALAAAFCDAAGVGERDTVLDVGCGPGPLLAELASRLGVEAVAGVDPSQPFVEACRERVAGAEVHQGRAETLPFADDSFDVALAQLVVNFMEDPRAGVADMGRVARRTVAACVWDYAGEMTMLRAFWDAALELDPSAPDEGAVMRHCTPSELEALWREVGLRDVGTGALVVEAAYADFDDYWKPFTTGLAPSGAYCASLGERDQAALREACRRRLGSPAGPFRLGARAWFVRGEAV